MLHRLGLTGGIATGKSTVSNYLSQRYQLPVLDADEFSHAAVQPGSPILEAIASRYGPQLLQPDGYLDRARLGQIVFNDAQERQWLEAQIHPVVRDRFNQTLTQLTDQPVVVLSIPLLFEANLTGLMTEIWVVSCTPSQQLDRLMARNNLDQRQAQQRIQTQLPLSQKCAAADVVLDNSQSRDRLWAQIDAQMSRLLTTG
ncbi:MAG: dephospho-CoA kinase [Cyanobacteria bacterium P01_G01_bin.54]